MKKILLATLLGSMLPAVSQAQSSVTLYGDTGGGVRWVNGTKGGSTVGFNNNVIAVNQFGFYGKEDLGNGLQTIFKLDGAFNSGTGAFKTTGTMFSQEAFVGLSGDFGRLTFGRQLNANENFSILVDPASGAGALLALEPGVLWAANYFTLDSRFSNTIKYLGRIGGFRFGASYSPGGVAGNNRAGTNISGAAMYQLGRAFGGISYQKTWNATATQWAQTFSTGGSFQAGPARLYVSYADLDVSAVNAAAPNRRDHIPGAGIVLAPTSSAFQFTAAVYEDIVSHLGNARSASGHKLTTYAIAEYFLSKRTEVYAEADYNDLSGAYRFDPTNLAALSLASGARSTTGVSLGLMTRF